MNEGPPPQFSKKVLSIFPNEFILKWKPSILKKVAALVAQRAIYFFIAFGHCNFSNQNNSINAHYFLMI